MTGDHHGQTAGTATLLVRALDGLLGTHRAELGSGQVVGQHDLTAECHRRFPASRWASPES